MEFRKTIFQAWKVLEKSKGHGKSWKMMIMSGIFTTAVSNSVKVTQLHLCSQIMNRYIFLTMVLRADGTVTTNSGMHS